jgi:hypothetical protein
MKSLTRDFIYGIIFHSISYAILYSVIYRTYRVISAGTGDPALAAAFAAVLGVDSLRDNPRKKAAS